MTKMISFIRSCKRAFWGTTPFWRWFWRVYNWGCALVILFWTLLYLTGWPDLEIIPRGVVVKDGPVLLVVWLLIGSIFIFWLGHRNLTPEDRFGGKRLVSTSVAFLMLGTCLGILVHEIVAMFDAPPGSYWWQDQTWLWLPSEWWIAGSFGLALLIAILLSLWFGQRAMRRLRGEVVECEDDGTPTTSQG